MRHPLKIPLHRVASFPRRAAEAILFITHMHIMLFQTHCQDCKWCWQNYRALRDCNFSHPIYAASFAYTFCIRIPSYHSFCPHSWPAVSQPGALQPCCTPTVAHTNWPKSSAAQGFQTKALQGVLKTEHKLLLVSMISDVRYWAQVSQNASYLLNTMISQLYIAVSTSWRIAAYYQCNSWPDDLYEKCFLA